MRLLTSTIVASARIFGTRIGNYSHVRTGQKHMRAKPVGTKKKAKNKIKKQKKILKTNTRFNAISCAHTMWLFCRSGNERLVSTSHEFTQLCGIRRPAHFGCQGASRTPRSPHRAQTRQRLAAVTEKVESQKIKKKKIKNKQKEKKKIGKFQIR